MEDETTTTPIMMPRAPADDAHVVASNPPVSFDLHSTTYPNTPLHRNQQQVHVYFGEKTKDLMTNSANEKGLGERKGEDAAIMCVCAVLNGPFDFGTLPNDKSILNTLVARLVSLRSTSITLARGILFQSSSITGPDPASTSSSSSKKRKIADEKEIPRSNSHLPISIIAKLFFRITILGPFFSTSSLSSSTFPLPVLDDVLRCMFQAIATAVFRAGFDDPTLSSSSDNHLNQQHHQQTSVLAYVDSICFQPHVLDRSHVPVMFYYPKPTTTTSEQTAKMFQTHVSKIVNKLRRTDVSFRTRSRFISADISFSGENILVENMNGRVQLVVLNATSPDQNTVEENAKRGWLLSMGAVLCGAASEDEAGIRVANSSRVADTLSFPNSGGSNANGIGIQTIDALYPKHPNSNTPEFEMARYVIAPCDKKPSQQGPLCELDRKGVKNMYVPLCRENTFVMFSGGKSDVSSLRVFVISSCE